MKTHSLSSTFSWIFLGLILAFATCARADQITSIIGFQTVPCPGGADTITSVPFHRTPSEPHATLEASPSINGSNATLSVADSPNYPAEAFTTEAHFLKFLTGPSAGSIFPVDSHTASEITIDRGTDPLAGVEDGDTFAVIPYWTLATLFPVASQSAFHISPGVLLPDRRSELLLFDSTSDGIELAPDQIYFPTPGGWKQADKGFPDAGDTLLPPHLPFVIRHQVGADATTFYPMQTLDAGPSAAGLRERADGPQDNAVSLTRPLAVKLKDLDLGSAFADSASTDPADRADQLFLYESLAGAADNDPALVYFRVGGTWHRDDGNSYPIANDEEIPAASGMLLRKAPGSDIVRRWLNLPRY